MSNANDLFERQEMIGPPLKVRGSLTLKEDVRADTIDVVGHLSTQKNVTTAKLKVSGDCSIGGYCRAEQVINLGGLRVQHIQADRLQSSGYFSAAQDAAVDTFYAEGAVKINRLTAGSSIELRLGNRSTIEVMRTSGTITVKPSLKLMNALIPYFRKLTCETIEGTSISLYRTTANLVCGEDIIIGPGCSIGEVQYSKSLTVDPKSQVDRTVFLNK
jgi:cytoskeletal protein CcmA (bactofilin family)